MTIETLKKAMTAQPFRAFTLQLASGSAAPVPHPEFLWIHPASPRTVIVGDNDGGVRIIDLLLVEELQFTNGKKRGK